jgi:hypothetical protein
MGVDMRRKVYSLFLTLFLSIFIAGNLMAQSTGPQPCVGDPDDVGFDPNSCPLDTWVIVLVVVVGILATIHLHRKQKSLQA